MKQKRHYLNKQNSSRLNNMFLGPTLLMIMIFVLAVIFWFEESQVDENLKKIKQQVDHQIILDAKRNEYMKNGIRE